MGELKVYGTKECDKCEREFTATSDSICYTAHGAVYCCPECCEKIIDEMLAN